jgi:hypothetical protein
LYAPALRSSLFRSGRVAIPAVLLSRVPASLTKPYVRPIIELAGYR